MRSDQPFSDFFFLLNFRREIATFRLLSYTIETCFQIHTKFSIELVLAIGFEFWGLRKRICLRYGQAS